MNFAPLEKIADAVLFEGYILYPYRPSSLKNRQRWNFGTLIPRSETQPQPNPEPCSFQAEVLVTGSAESCISARVRFLQLLPAAGKSPQEWNRGLTRSGIVEPRAIREISAGVTLDLPFPSSPPAEPQNPERLEGPPFCGRLILRAESLRQDFWRLRATFSNETPLPDPGSTSAVRGSAFVSAHLLLGVEGGEFVSLLDPPPADAAAAAACVNRGVFPVLAGEAGDRSHMLCSPIILYDYPQIAPESPGDFFDGTEMDEMLALRVLTLTEEEKAEMRAGDPHAAAILARTETLPADHLMKLHGAVRGLSTASAAQSAGNESRIEPWNPFAERPPLQSVRVFGVEVRCGDRVRLWPGKKADILDIAMNGKVAIVEAIEQDLEDQVQFAVVLEDDPGRDLGLLRQAGHRFFFSPEEIEPLGMEVP